MSYNDIDNILNGGLEAPVHPVSENRTELPEELKRELLGRTPPFAQTMIQTIRQVDEYCKNRGEMGGMDWGFDNLNNAFQGLNAGVHLIAGQSNIGKSAICMQLGWQIAMANQIPTPERPQKAFVLYFSLDDSMNELLPRFVAIDQKMPINAVRFPKKFGDNIRFMEKRDKGFKKLEESVMHISMKDVNEGSSIEYIEKTIDEYVTQLKMIDDAYQIVVFIDNFHDVTVDAPGFTEANTKFEHIADGLSRICAKYDCPMVCTAEFRKLNGNRRPVLDDIKESGKIVYEAKAILLSFNEVSYRNQQANIFWLDEDDPTQEKKPVYEMHVGKNKFGSFKGRLFYNFKPHMSYFMEVPEAMTQKYNQMITG